MTFIPVNFGMSSGGNTAGTSGTVSNQLVFAGGNNVTLSQSTTAGSATITISAGAGGGSNTFGVSNLGNTAGTSGTINGTAAQLLFAGGNNVTLSQSVNGSSATVTVSAASQTNQSVGLYAVSNTTQSSSATVDARSLSFAGAGNVSIGASNGSVVIANRSTWQMNAVGNTVSWSSGTGVASFAYYSATGNASFGASNGTLLVSVAPNSLGVSNLGNTSGSTGTVSNQLVFAGGNNITLSQSTNAGNATITVSAPNASSNTFGISNLGNTSGTSGTINGAAAQLVFAGGNNITLSQSVNASSATITISGAAGGAGGSNTFGMSNLGNTSGTSGTVNGSAVQFAFAGGNNVTLSQSLNGSSGTITISAAAVGAGSFSAGVSTGGNTLGTTGTQGNQLVFVGGNNITLSQSANAQSGTITIVGPSAGAGVTLSSYEPWPIHNTGTAVISANTNTSGSASFIPFNLPAPVAVRHINVLMTMNMTTGGTSSYNQSRTMNWGIYSQGSGTQSTQLYQMTSSSLSFAMSYNNSNITVSQATTTNDTGYGYSTTASAGLNLSSQYTGLKMMQLLVLTTLNPDVYWLGLFDRASSSRFNSGILQSYYGNAISLTGIAPMGSLSRAYTAGTNLLQPGGAWLKFAGQFTSAGQTNLPGNLAISALTNNLIVVPYMSLATTA